MIEHYIAYGNSDQQSFRTTAVRAAMHGVVLPGTIASYYPDATAAFILSLQHGYFIDPRTPLFQGRIVPRKSHVTLAAWHGAAVLDRITSPEEGTPVAFDHTLFDARAVRDMVESIVKVQRDYGERSASHQETLSHYEALLAEADPNLGKLTDEQARRPPLYVLAPYFGVRSPADPWLAVQREIWDAIGGLDDPASISPVVLTERVADLTTVLAGIPSHMSPTTFFWIPEFKEKSLSIQGLTALRDAIQRETERPLINLYGGYFSICLSKFGLRGFSNGLGYSESRDWPALAQTGAAPARYYLPRVHAFVTPAIAEIVLDVAPEFRCPCETCTERSVADLSYGQLKQHFAAARRGEIDFVDASDTSAIATDLRGAFQDFEAMVRDVLPTRKPLVSTDHLLRWADALS